MNPQEMLMLEQLIGILMESVEEFACNNNISEDDMEDLIRVLCDVTSAKTFLLNDHERRATFQN